jgi:hypothetical protein
MSSHTGNAAKERSAGKHARQLAAQTRWDQRVQFNACNRRREIGVKFLKPFDQSAF